VDVDRAAELYAAGWTLRRIGAELGVDHSTVAYRLRRAGVTLRRGGARRHDVDTQHILDPGSGHDHGCDRGSGGNEP
jgi:hypothetical protein